LAEIGLFIKVLVGGRRDRLARADDVAVLVGRDQVLVGKLVVLIMKDKLKLRRNYMI
jgi:hypothetical protein